MQRKYGKLVRDRIIEIIIRNGEYPTYRTLEEKEYLKELKRKLIEEAREVVKTKTREELVDELSDLQEVQRAIAKANKISLEEIEERRKFKSVKRGGFEDRIYLESVEEKEN